MNDSRFEPATPFSEKELGMIERVLGRKLPNDYCKFVSEYGGAFVGGLVAGNEELPMLKFLGADEANGVLAKLKTHTDLRDDGVLPFAVCELGNLYVLDRDNTVHYVNYYGGKTTARKAANSFGDLLARIIVSDE